QATLCLAPLGRAALVGLAGESMSIFPYPELINKEAEIIGVSDHLASELRALLEFARTRKLSFPPEALRLVDLDVAQINAALDALQHSIAHVRTVIVPNNELGDDGSGRPISRGHYRHPVTYLSRDSNQSADERTTPIRCQRPDRSVDRSNAITRKPGVCTDLSSWRAKLRQS